MACRLIQSEQVGALVHNFENFFRRLHIFMIRLDSCDLRKVVLVQSLRLYDADCPSVFLCGNSAVYDPSLAFKAEEVSAV